MKVVVAFCVLAVGCVQTEREPNDTPVDSVSASPDTVPVHPDSAALARYRMLPDGVLARRNACPFECCGYGSWVADTTIPMHGNARSTAAPLFTLAKGDSVRADSGVVYVTSIALVAVEDSVPLGAGNRTWLLPGDTLVLLDPIGEGYWTAWRRGEIVREVPPFFESWWRPKVSGKLIGTSAREWWVHGTVKGRSGWFRPDRFRVRGADGCA